MHIHIYTFCIDYVKIFYIISKCGFYSRDTTLSAIQTNYKKYNKRIQEWLKIRPETIDLCDKLIQQLIDHHHAMNRVRTAGSAAGITGGAIAISGLVMSPFTGGLSLALASGIGLSIAGGATVAGAGFSDASNQRQKAEEVNRQYTKDQEALKEAIQYAQNAKECIERLTEKTGNIDKKLVNDSIRATCLVTFESHQTYQMVQVSAGGGFEVGKLPSQTEDEGVSLGLTIATLPLRALLFPKNVYEMVVKAVRDIQHGEENEVTKELRKFRADLVTNTEGIKLHLYPSYREQLMIT